MVARKTPSITKRKHPTKHLTLATSALALGLGFGAAAPAAEKVTKTAVLQTYADIAAAKYADSLTTAKSLQAAVDALIEAPSAEALQHAKEAWLAARVPYQQTEVYRFGNAIVDDWEGKVNAWPLDEGLIDYVESAYGGPSDENAFAVLNVVANPSFTLSGDAVDARQITPELLAETLHEADGIEANVATGYHAIEFLLWGRAAESRVCLYHRGRRYSGGGAGASCRITIVPGTTIWCRSAEPPCYSGRAGPSELRISTEVSSLCETPLLFFSTMSISSCAACAPSPGVAPAQWSGRA